MIEENNQSTKLLISPAAEAVQCLNVGAGGSGLRNSAVPPTDRQHKLLSNTKSQDSQEEFSHLIPLGDFMWSNVSELAGNLRQVSPVVLKRNVTTEIK